MLVQVVTSQSSNPSSAKVVRTASSVEMTLRVLAVTTFRVCANLTAFALNIEMPSEAAGASVSAAAAYAAGSEGPACSSEPSSVTCRLIFFGRLLGMGSSDPLRAFFVFPIARCRWSRVSCVTTHRKLPFLSEAGRELREA